MATEYKFNFFVVKLAREDIFTKVRFYQKPSFVEQPSRALPFRTFKNADECAKSYERIGFKAEVLKFEAKQTTITGEEK